MQQWNIVTWSSPGWPKRWPEKKRQIEMDTIHFKRGWHAVPWQVLGWRKAVHPKASWWLRCCHEMLKPETLGLCVCLSMEKNNKGCLWKAVGQLARQRQKMTKAGPKCRLNAPFTHGQTVQCHFYRLDPVFGMMIFKWCGARYPSVIKQNNEKSLRNGGL